MLKSWKLWTTVGVLALAISSVGFGTFWSYAKTLWSKAGRTFREHVPIEFQIDRLSMLIEDAQKELRRNEQAVARMEVEVEQLQKEVVELEQRIARQKAEMAKLREALRNESQQTFEFGGKTFTRRQVELDLNRRLHRLQSSQAILKDKKQALEKQQQVLEESKILIEKAHDEIERLIARRDELKQLKKRLDMQPVPISGVDASKLQEALYLAEDIHKELLTKQKELEKHSSGGQIPVELDDRPLLERVDEVLSN